jgi:predicted nuclease of predicted toxin-antitoxin system
MSSSAILDENVSLDVQLVLESFGHRVTAIALLSERGISDAAVFDMAMQQNAILITRDRDFTNSIRFPPTRVQAILYLMDGNLTGVDEAVLVRRFLENHPLPTFQGKFISLSPHITRIR